MIDIKTALGVISSGGAVSVQTSRDILRAEGPEATHYLQGQISQNVETLKVGHTTWSFVLQPQGKVDAWFRLTRVGDETYVFDLEPGFGQQALDRLNRFKLGTKVDFTLHSTTMTSVRGAEAESYAQRLADAINGLAVPAGWDHKSPLDVLHVDDDGMPLAAGEGAVDGDLQPAEEEFLDWDRISRGIPAMGSEMDDSTIPGATAVVDVSADFSKGCYVGQELVARVDSRGSNTPTKLVRISAATSTTVAVGASLIVGDATVGEITSVASSGERLLGLGYLKRSALADQSEATLQAVLRSEDGVDIDVSVDLVIHPI